MWNKHERYTASALHQPIADTRVLYLFGDPFNTVTYFLQRSDKFLRSLRFHCEMMSCRLPEIESLILNNKLSKEDVLCCLVMSSDADSASETGIDFLELEHHFRGWWQHDDRQYSIMFVRYETLSDHIDKIVQYIGAPQLLDFEFRKRRSDYRSLSLPHQKGLNKSLGAFRSWLQSLPDISLFNATLVKM